MRYPRLTAAMLIGVTSLPVSARAQSTAVDPRTTSAVGVTSSQPKPTAASNIAPAGKHSNIAPLLPSPWLGTKGDTGDYLRVAYAALAKGRTGLAQQSLEMAETRVLGGPVVKGTFKVPGEAQKVSSIRHALHALGEGDKTQAREYIKLALLD